MLRQGDSGQIRPREDRQRVMLPARMRSSSGWTDACILNISTRGLLVYSKGAAQPGNFVEIRRGGQLVVARVVWRKNQRIGLQSPDPVRVEDIISTETAASAVESAVGRRPVERRRVPRDPDRSRQHGRAIEFMTIVLTATTLVGAAVATVEDAFVTPLAAVRMVLGSR